MAKDFGLALVNGKAAFGVGNADFTITSSSTINDGNWHHLAATLNTDSLFSADAVTEIRQGKVPLGNLDPARGLLRLRVK